MQENNEQLKNVSSESSSKPKKANKNENKKGSFFADHKSEFKKITWPNRKILTKQTITVIFISIIVSVIILGYDFCIDFVIQNLVKFMA